jgi:hypothetical protein
MPSTLLVKGEEWIAVGAQFQHPYVFKQLFSGEEVTFQDLCEGRSVQKGTMYLGKDVEEPDYKEMRHVGKTGLFVPVTEGGAKIYRVHEGKYYAVAGTKGYMWMEAEVAKEKKNLKVDMSYFEKLREDAIAAIEKFGSFNDFVT